MSRIQFHPQTKFFTCRFLIRHLLCSSDCKLRFLGRFTHRKSWFNHRRSQCNGNCFVGCYFGRGWNLLLFQWGSKKYRLQRTYCKDGSEKRLGGSVGRRFKCKYTQNFAVVCAYTAFLLRSDLVTLKACFTIRYKYCRMEYKKRAYSRV